VLRTPTLGVASLLYDVTPPRFVAHVCSEAGLSGPESVAELLRDFKSAPYMHK
jgi:translation initiation factor 2B subunit (eIF-2B alpha/beta/delta family)